MCVCVSLSVSFCVLDVFVSTVISFSLIIFALNLQKSIKFEFVLVLSMSRAATSVLIILSASNYFTKLLSFC